MTEYQKKISRLKNHVGMKTPEDVNLFEELVYELAEQKTPGVLDDLINLFDDKCEHPEVMYSLVHAIETFPDKLYIQSILKNISKLEGRLEWFLTLFYGIFNSNDCYLLLKKYVKELPQNNRLIEVLDVIYQESEMHREQVEELRSILNANK